MSWRARSSGGAERPQALVRAVAHGRGMGADEERRHRDMARRRQGHVQRQVMALEAASPTGSGRACRRSRRNSGRDRGSCPAARAARLRRGARSRALQPALVQHRGEQRPRRLGLRRLHLAQGEALAAARDVVPVEPVGGLEGDQRLAALAVVERGEEAVGLHRRCAGRHRPSARWRRRTAGTSRRPAPAAASAGHGHDHGRAHVRDRHDRADASRRAASRDVRSALRRTSACSRRAGSRPRHRLAGQHLVERRRAHTAWPSAMSATFGRRDRIDAALVDQRARWHR